MKSMKHRGEQYSVVLSIGGKWKWSVEIDGHTKSSAGIDLAEAELIGHSPRRRSAWCGRRADQHITFGPF
jgi:hypothetical protein